MKYDLSKFFAAVDAEKERQEGSKEDMTESSKAEKVISKEIREAYYRQTQENKKRPNVLTAISKVTGVSKDCILEDDRIGFDLQSDPGKLPFGVDVRKDPNEEMLHETPRIIFWCSPGKSYVGYALNPKAKGITWEDKKDGTLHDYTTVFPAQTTIVPFGLDSAFNEYLRSKNEIECIFITDGKNDGVMDAWILRQLGYISIGLSRDEPTKDCGLNKLIDAVCEWEGNCPPIMICDYSKKDEPSELTTSLKEKFEDIKADVGVVSFFPYKNLRECLITNPKGFKEKMNSVRAWWKTQREIQEYDDEAAQTPERPVDKYEQDLMEWFPQWFRKEYPDIRLIRIPNEMARDSREGLMFKKQGMQRGTPDYFVAECRVCYGGLWIETKSEHGGKLSRDQEIVIKKLKSAGYKVVVCKNREEIQKAVQQYLSLDESPFVSRVTTPQLRPIESACVLSGTKSPVATTIDWRNW